MPMPWTNVAAGGASGMDYDAVNGMATGFDTAGDTLQVVSQMLTAAISALALSAFLGNVGAGAQIAYLSNIKPKVDKLAATCEEFGTDLRLAVQKREELDAASAGQITD
jgi:uncharacterized protein YukE